MLCLEGDELNLFHLRCCGYTLDCKNCIIMGDFLWGDELNLFHFHSQKKACRKMSIVVSPLIENELNDVGR